MKYLCLIYEDPKQVQSMTRTEGEAIMGEYFAFTDDIKKTGHYLRPSR